jgi:hypothetical protein
LPRKALIDAPGALQHISCFGIGGRKIFSANEGAMTLLSDWVSLQKKAALNVLPGKSSRFRKRPGLWFYLLNLPKWLSEVHLIDGQRHAPMLPASRISAAL